MLCARDASITFYYDKKYVISKKKRLHLFVPLWKVEDDIQTLDWPAQ